MAEKNGNERHPKDGNKNLPQAKAIPNSQENDVHLIPVPEDEYRTLVARATMFSGPLPPPEILRNYNRIIPDSAERILKMVEDQSRHRRNIEKKVIKSDIDLSWRGLHYGLIIGLSTILGGVLCISIGYEIGGTILGGTGLTGLVSVFVYGSRQKRKELEDKLKFSVQQERLDSMPD